MLVIFINIVNPYINVDIQIVLYSMTLHIWLNIYLTLKVVKMLQYFLISINICLFVDLKVLKIEVMSKAFNGVHIFIYNW